MICVTKGTNLLGEHAKAASSLGKVTARNLGSGLSADTELEASGAPVDELNRLLGLDACDRGGSVLGDDITTVEQAARHVLALTGVALHHLVSGLEAREGHLRDGVLLMVGLVSRDERREAGDGEVDAREAVMICQYA